MAKDVELEKKEEKENQKIIKQGRKEEEREEERYDKGTKKATYLCKRQFLAAAEERLGISQQRFQLLDNQLNEFLAQLILFLVGHGIGLDPEREGLGNERVGEEVDPGPAKGAAFFVGGRDKVGGMGVGEELGDDSGLGDDLAVVGKGGDEPAGVDLEVLGGAGHGKVNDFLLEVETQLGEGDVSAMSPWPGPC